MQQTDATAASPSTHTRFFILCRARTGSTMLASSLNGSPDIICFRELFNPIMDGIGYHVEGYDNQSAEDQELRNRDFKEFLRRRIFCAHPEEIRAVGFKMPSEHFLAVPALLDWLADDPEIRVIHLKRRNLLRMLVSLRIALRTGGWSEDRKRTLGSKFKLANVPGAARHPLRALKRLRKFMRPPEPEWKAQRTPLSLTAAECREFFEQTEREAKYYSDPFGSHPGLTLYYEDLLSNRRETLNRVQAFLGVERRRLAPTTRRQNPEPMRELIENYDELYEAFRDTPREAFFE